MIKIHYEREDNAKQTHCELEGSGPELLRAISEIVLLYCEQVHTDPIMTCAGICAAQEFIKPNIERIERFDCAAIQRAKDGISHE